MLDDETEKLFNDIGVFQQCDFNRTYPYPQGSKDFQDNQLCRACRFNPIEIAREAFAIYV